MTRRVPADRLERLVDAAARVFIDQGYRRTQMGDIADALGVAKGTLYLYVESKEALFDFALRHADRTAGLEPPATLPIPAPAQNATRDYVAARLERESRLAALERALQRPSAPSRAGAVAELEEIVGEFYDVLARNARGIKLLDASAPDLPELAALWYQGAREGAVAGLASYLEGRIGQGLLRAVPSAQIAARLIIETAVFWAVHRHFDPLPQSVSEEDARATVLGFVVGALTEK